MFAIDLPKLSILVSFCGAFLCAVAGACLAADEESATDDAWNPLPTVRRIEFERIPIFDEEDRERLSWLPLGLVNRLHATTRKSVIRRELLFVPGGPLDPEILEESERKLRDTGFFAEVSILPVFVARDSIDVVVRTREIWTTEANFGYERFEQQVAWSALLRESNFLGTAKAVDLARSVDEDRATWRLGLSDRQLFDGLWRGGVSVSDSDDGPGAAWILQRPFQSVGALAGGGAGYYHQGQRPRYHLSGSRYVRPYSDVTEFGAQFLRRVAVSDHRSLRMGFGVTWRHRRFAAERKLIVFSAAGATDQRYELPPNVDESRRTHLVSFILESATRRYLKRRFIYSMGNIEDIPLGHRGRFEIAWATRAFEASHSGLFLAWQQAWAGQRAGGLWTARGNSVGMWPTRASVIDLRASADVAAYYPIVSSLTLATGLSSATGSNLDAHQVYTLGIDNGLRAARFREFAGDRLLRLNAELRWVYRPGLAGLLTPGLVGFFDAGHVWFEDERDLVWEDIRGAVGVGLRLGFVRSSQRLPVRIDLGWPVLYDNERPGAILSIGTGQIF